jgi:hypothetical protein
MSEEAETTLDDRIEELAGKARSTTVLGVTVSEQSIQDVIAADKHLARKAATSSVYMGIRMGRFIPPGH